MENYQDIIGYVLNDGKCKITYSFKVEYYTDRNNLNIPIINNFDKKI